MSKLEAAIAIDKLKHDSLQQFLDAERRETQVPEGDRSEILGDETWRAWNRYRSDLCFDSVEDLIGLAHVLMALDSFQQKEST